MSQTFRYYSNWKDEVVTCPSCKWTGKVSDAGREVYHELMDYSCPTCDTMLAIIPFPTEEEVREAAAEGNTEAKKELRHRKQLNAWWKKAGAMMLKSPADLPDFQGERLCFVWDMVWGEKEKYVEIKYLNQVIWREFALWEGWERFNAVKNILKAKYGERFGGLTPTAGSEKYLYGDDGRADEKIEYR